MTFLGRRRIEGGASVALPITPMLDMSFQLLFFFIATFHLPTGMEGQMALALPGDSAHPGPAPAPPAGDLDLRDDLTLTLKGDTAGQSADGVSALTLVGRSGSSPLPYSKDLKELRESLGEIVGKGLAPSVKVHGDGKVKWRGVVKVMDACREAGVEDITFAPPPDDAGNR